MTERARKVHFTYNFYLRQLCQNMSKKLRIRNQIEECSVCKTVGWNGGSPFLLFDNNYYSFNSCPVCSGTGYIIPNIDEVEVKPGIYLCNQCYGSGCSDCMYEGTVDWLQHIRQRASK